MKKPYFIFLFLIIFFNCSFSQTKDYLSEKIILPFEINHKNGKSLVNWSESAIRSSIKDLKVLSIDELFVNDTDLEINYSINQIAPNLTYQLGMNLITADNQIIHVPVENFTSANNSTLIWKNLVEENINFNENYSLYLQLNASGINCNQPPTFNLAQRLPYYAGAVVGLGSIGLGQIYKQQSEQGEEEYLRIWREGGVANLEEAKDDFDKYRTYTYVGLGILAVDGVLFFLRQKRHKKKLNHFNRFCQEQVEVNLLPGISEGMENRFMVKIKF